MQRNSVILKKVLLLLFVVFLLPFRSNAQSSQHEITWQRGVVVLNSGDSIKGPLTLTMANDIVRVAQPEGRVSTFSAVNVKAFKVENEAENRFFRRNRNSLLYAKREYCSLMWNHDKDYSDFKSPAFFVVLQPGKQTLLMREQIERRTENMSPYSNYPGTRQSVESRVEKLYLLTPDERIVPLRNPKNDILASYPGKEKLIISFAKSNKLEFTDPMELSRIVAYANDL